MFQKEFEDIRPYYDSEINAALNRLTSYSQFKNILHFLYPESEHSNIINLLNNENDVMCSATPAGSNIRSLYIFYKPAIPPGF